MESAEVRKERGKPEVGSIYLNAYQEGNNVVIEVRDDGNGINVKANASDFSINPLMKTELDGNNINFYDVETDYSKYVELNFYVRNNGKKPVTLTGVNFYKNSKTKKVFHR